MPGLPTIRRTLLVIGAVALVWALAVEWTGGFFWQIGPFRLSSRDAWRPFLLAIAAALGLVVFAGPAGRRSAVRRVWTWIRIVGRWVGRAGEWTLAGVRWLGRFRHRVPVKAALTIAVAGILFDVYRWSGTPTMWLDEQMIALNVRDRSFAELSGPLWLEQSAPYGWLVLQRAVLLTLGDGERALRFVPLAFGVATILGALWVGRRWLGPIGVPGLVLLCWASPALAHYRFEVKHYTADIFFGLMLPALAVWAIEGDSVRTRTRRASIWWVVAAAAQWLANGALLVTPGCAVVLLAAIWRRDGLRAAAAAGIGGILWLAAFAAHYGLSLRFTEHLRAYWGRELPPYGVSLPEMAHWLVRRLQLLAENPAGTGLWLSLWLLATAGFVADGRKWLGAAFAIVPASAFAYALASFLPLYQRFSIWIVPGLYVGVMLTADRAFKAIRPAWTAHRWGWLAISILTMVLTVRLGADIVKRGYDDLEIPHVREFEVLNDRAGVRSLMAQRRAGDAVMTTLKGWPAIWWYGRIPIGDRSQAAAIADGYIMRHVKSEPECRRYSLERRRPNARRLLVYLGFPDVPNGFEGLLRQSLDRIGVVTGYHKFTGIGRIFVVDLDQPPTEPPPIPADPGDAAETLPGCVAIEPARRW